MKSRKQLKVAVILLFVVACGAFYLKVQMPEDKAVEYVPADVDISMKSDDLMETDERVEEDVSSLEPRSTGEGQDPQSEQQEKRQELVIHVCGAVRQEGVYYLQAGTRVVDAIEAAGGLTEDAAGAYLNQAELLTDGVQIYVPTAQEVEGQEVISRQSDSGQDDGRVDLNRADKAELMTLPGIGESKAEAILTYRQEHGSFESVEELMKVPGIKEGTFAKIKQQIAVYGK